MLTRIGMELFREQAGLWRDYGPNQTMIDAALDGYTPASFWVDSKNAESGMLLLNKFGVAFGWGDGFEGVLREQSAAQKMGVLYVPRDGESRVSFGKPVPRYEFSQHSGMQSLSAILDVVPERLRTIDLNAANAHQSTWKSVILAIFGDYENFQKSGGGAALTDGETLIAEAIIGFVGRSHTEIGTVTHPLFRAKGYSTYACAELIRRLLEQGQHPLWSCRQDNLGSVKVAERLGFKFRKPYMGFEIGF